jgi:hypothetical protein
MPPKLWARKISGFDVGVPKPEAFRVSLSDEARWAILLKELLPASVVL